jgi:hypothetical protein
MKTLAGVMGFLALASFAVLGWALRSRPALDPGDLLVFAVFSAFGVFCAVLAWRFFRAPPLAPAAQPEAPAGPSPKRVSASRLCAAAGVLLMMLATVVPETWYPVVPLFAGIVFLCVSHVLTPCVERLDQLRKARSSLHQL